MPKFIITLLLATYISSFSQIKEKVVEKLFLEDKGGSIDKLFFDKERKCIVYTKLEGNKNYLISSNGLKKELQVNDIPIFFNGSNLLTIQIFPNDWKQYCSKYNVSALTLKLSNKVELPFPGVPTISNDRIALSTAYEGTGSTIFYYDTNLKKIKEYTPFSNNYESDQIKFNNSNLFILFNLLDSDFELHRLSLKTGNLEKKVKIKSNGFRGSGFSIVDTNVYVKLYQGTTSKIISYSKNLKFLWSKEFLNTNLMVAGGLSLNIFENKDKQLMVMAFDGLLCLNPTNGEVIWKKSIEEIVGLPNKSSLTFYVSHFQVSVKNNLFFLITEIVENNKTGKYLLSIINKNGEVIYENYIHEEVSWRKNIDFFQYEFDGIVYLKINKTHIYEYKINP